MSRSSLYTIRSHRANGDPGCRFINLETVNGIKVDVCVDCCTVHVEGTSEVFYRQSCGHVPVPAECALCALEHADTKAELVESASYDEVALSVSAPQQSPAYALSVQQHTDAVVAYMFEEAPEETEDEPQGVLVLDEVDNIAAMPAALQLDMFGAVILPEVEPTPEPKKHKGWFARAMKLQPGLAGFAA